MSTMLANKQNATKKKFFARIFKVGVNPIVIRELRQSVRSRFMIGIVIFFLLFLLGATGITLLATEVHNQSSGSSIGFSTGQTLFSSLFSLLMFVCVFLFPIYIATRLGSERNKNGLDLLYISTLSPSAIIRGKFFSGIVLLVLIFSLSLPFLTFTYLLRGIDIPTIFVITGGGFLIAMAMVAAAILFACLPLSKVFKIVIGVLVGFLMLGFVPQIILVSLMGYGAPPFTSMGINLSSWQFWGATAAVIGIIGIAIGLMNVLSAALIAPKTANRALPVRCFVTAMWLISGLIAATTDLIHTPGSGNVILAWLWASVLLMAATILIAVSENEHLSFRIRKSIPRKRGARKLIFPFYSGPAGGVIWTILIAGASFLIAFGVHPSLLGDKDNWHPLLAVFLYFYSYGLTALLIHRFLLKKLSPAITWLIALSLMFLATILPLIIILFSGTMSLDDYENWQYGNPFALFDESHRSEHMGLAATWALLVSLVHIPWFSRQFRKFKPLGDENATPKKTLSSNSEDKQCTPNTANS